MHVFIRKLRSLHSLSEEEQSAMLGEMEPPRALERGTDIAEDGSTPTCSTVIVDGIACRYKMFPDGRRQILNFQYPGDMTDLYSYALKKLDHAIGTLTDVTISQISHEKIRQLCEQYPNLAYALWRDSLVDTAKLHAALMNVGRRSAKERLAHLLCEHFVRLNVVGLAELGKPIQLNVTQNEIADASGLSLVHVNKTLKLLKDNQLIGRNANALEILDWEGLFGSRAADLEPE